MFKFLKNIFKNEENNFIGEVDAMNNNQLVCNCFKVTVKDIKNAVEAGAKSFEEVQNVTKAGTGCGGCVNKVKALVKELL